MCRDEFYLFAITDIIRVRASMVSSISSINQYPVSRDVLEVVRRLQSLGVAPTGNISIDRQRLQTAELQKKQQTLASNSEYNLNSIQGTSKDFSSTLNNIGVVDASQTLNNTGIKETRPIGLIENANAVTDSKCGVGSGNDDVGEMNPARAMVGATQLAELNKLKLGLIA